MPALPYSRMRSRTRPPIASESGTPWDLAHDIPQRDFDRAVSLAHSGSRARSASETDAQRIRIGNLKTDQKGRDGIRDQIAHRFAARSGCVTHDSHGGLDTNQHRIPLHDRRSPP